MNIPNDVLTLIQNSGNSFHAKVARWFSGNGWHIVVSPYYMDQTQNKAREIDLIAEKPWPIKDIFGNTSGYVTARLFIECKFIPSYSVFWFAEKDMKSAKELVLSSGSFSENMIGVNINNHHYLGGDTKIAKLFATSANKNHENDPFYKALNQAISAMVSMRGLPVSIPNIQHSHESLEIISFPVVVCSSFDQMYSVDFYTESQPELIKNNFQLEVRYAYTDMYSHHFDEYLLLDFIEFEKLGEFIKAIEVDAAIATAIHSES